MKQLKHDVDLSFKKAPRTVQVTLNEELADTFEWMINNDEQFGDKKAAEIIQYLALCGARHLYEEGLKNVTPLDEDVADKLAEQSLTHITRALDE